MRCPICQKKARDAYCPDCGFRFGKTKNADRPPKKKSPGCVTALILIGICVTAISIGFAAYEWKEERSDTIETPASKSKIEIVSARLVYNDVGTECIAVKYRWRNNSDAPRSFWSNFTDFAYQDEALLQTAVIDKASGFYEKYEEIQPGKSQKFQLCYVLNGVGDIRIEILGGSGKEAIFAYGSLKKIVGQPPQ